ncbi:MAG: ketopantoate reductase family protein [Chloroflexota bacterium]
MRILIVGAGAIGSLVGAKLALRRHAVALVARPPAVEAIHRDGLRLIEDGAQLTVRDVEAVPSVRAAFADSPAFDLAIFAMKAYGVAESATELDQATPEPPPVLMLQNGVGSEECVTAILPLVPVIAGSITTPAEMRAPGLVEVSRSRRGLGLAATRPEQSLDALARVLRGAGFQVRVYADYRALKWSKLLLNLVGNATSAILDLLPAEVFADPRLFRVELGAFREAVAVMRAMGVKPVGLPGYPLPGLAPVLLHVPQMVLQPLMGRIIAGGRGGKLPSLYADLAQRRERSEVEFLNGAVVRHGREVGVATPVNQVLADTLSGLVQGRFHWAEFRGRPERLLAELGW